MSTRRTLLRIPALLGVFLLLFSGVREAYAFGACPMMHPGGGQVEVAEQAAAGGEMDGAHAHHVMPPAPEIPTGSQHDGHSGDQEDSGCECRLLCLSVPVPTPPEPVVLRFDPGLPPESSTSPVVEDRSLLPSLQLPYLLPFANAPPSDS